MRASVIVLWACLGAGQISAQTYAVIARLAQLPEGSHASLSPDGSTAALVRWNDTASELTLHSFATSDSRVVRRDDGDERVQWCIWKTETRLLCAATRARNRLSIASGLDGHSIDGLATLLVIDLSTSGARPIGSFEGLLSVLPDDPAHAVIERAGRVGTVDLATGKFEAGLPRGAPLTRATASGITDGRGVLRIRRGNVGWLMLPTTASRWVVLHPYEHGQTDLFAPVAFDERTNEAFYIDTHEDRTALFAADAGGSRADRLVLAPPSAYVTQVTMVGKNPRPAQAVVFGGRARFEPLDPNVAQTHLAVGDEFPDSVIDVFDEDWNQRYYLVRVTDRAGVGQYLRFDLAERRLDGLAATHTNAVVQPTPPRAPLSFASAEGRDIVAYATLPRQGTPPWPLIVMPAESGAADQLVPFLVAKGYAVLELPMPPTLMHGDGVDLHAAVRDIGPAVLAIAATQPVDSARVCAVGTEYGAYVALLHASQDHTLLRCVVGIETVVNPDWKEATSLRAEGPPMLASVLLLEGFATFGVPRLHRELANEGVSIELAEYWRYEHSEFRSAFYDKLAGFLELHLR